MKRGHPGAGEQSGGFPEISGTKLSADDEQPTETACAPASAVEVALSFLNEQGIG